MEMDQAKPEQNRCETHSERESNVCESKEKKQQDKKMAKLFCSTSSNLLTEFRVNPLR